MILALRSGVPHDVWLDDPRALVTALELYREVDARARRRGR